MALHRFRFAALAVLLASGLGAAPAQDPPPLPARQTAFLKGIQAGKIRESYGELLAGSLILEKKSEVDNLVSQTTKGLEVYGGVTSIEDLGILREDRHLAFGAALVCCERAPLFFYFIWYRTAPAAPWKAHNVWFDDNARAFLEHRK